MADIVRRRPSAVTRSPFEWPFRRLFEDLYQVFGDERSLLPELWSEGHFVPAIDVVEKDDEVVLTAEVPGMSHEDLEVTVDNGILTIRGEKKEEDSSRDGDYQRVERRYGRFERQIRLPDYVDADRIEATHKDGVLKLRMPKVEAAKARTIQIKRA